MSDHYMAQAFAELSTGAKRKKIYARKATRDGRPEVARLLRAVAASEAAQARRLFNSMIGRVDTSEDYLATVFTKEIQTVLDNYGELLASANADRPALLQAVTQLRAAETRLRSFYSPESRDVAVEKDARYFVCSFCGYLGSGHLPEKCPICGASPEAFQQID